LWGIGSRRRSPEIFATTCKPCCGLTESHRSYSDSDTPNGPILETILKRIRAADFSIFDDRETEVRPNVLIELGAAIGMRRPYFYFNYANNRTVRIGRKHESITTARDLAGMQHLPYASYRGLFVEFAQRLPAFLLDRLAY
jgi:hypothetical protein